MSGTPNKWCIEFAGGYCHLVGKHVPRSWCFNRCRLKKQPPNIIQQAVTFTKAAGKQLVAGNPKRTDTQVQEIADTICNRTCEYYRVQHNRPRCMSCGCWLDVKAMWATAHCPKGKW